MAEAKERDPHSRAGSEAKLVAEMLSVVMAGVRQVREALVQAREEERIDPQELWEKLTDLNQEERLFVVEVGREYQTSELAEWIAAESAAREAGNPKEAAELAELAQRVKELAPG
jgi:erythromycin esterase-like protein